MAAEFASLVGSRQVEFLSLCWTQIDTVIRLKRAKQAVIDYNVECAAWKAATGKSSLPSRMKKEAEARMTRPSSSG